jgi:hypothetical protein
LSFTIAAGPRQRIYSQVPSSAGLKSTVYCLRFETASTWSPGPHIYIPQEQGGPVIPPVTGFFSVAFYDSQGYAGGNSNPPPHPGGPVCYILTLKFEVDRIQNIAEQTFEEAVIVYSTEVNRFTKCTFLFPSYHCP